jgi:ankyrin repeat protein
LLRHGVKVDDRKQQADLLIESARRGSIAAAEALIAAGVDVDVRAKDGSTALIVAAGKGQAHMVRALLAAGANPKAKTKKEGGALHAALCCASLGNDPKDAKTSGGGSLEAVRLLLAQGADPNEANGEGSTAAIQAAGLPAYLRLLIDAGADVNRADKKGEDAIFWAIVHSATESVRMLLEAGIRVDRISERGAALDFARSRTGGQEIVKLLLEHGATAGEESAEGRKAKRQVEAKKQQHEEKEQKRQEASAAARPDFSQAAKSATFARAVTRLGEVTGQPTQVVDELPGLVISKPGGKDVDGLLQRHRAEFLELGATLCVYEMPAFGGEHLAILPTVDPLQAVAAIHWGGANQDLDLKQIIDGLREVAEKHARYTIERIAGDKVVGRFTAKIRAPRKLAELLYRICPDIVEQGTETVAALAKQLARTDRLFLWWD